MKYLTDEKRIKAVTVCFTDLEGRLHMLDYDKKFLLKSADNLTFDGSSIRGFSQQAESDLRLAIDWPAFYWLPSDIFGAGKVLVFGEVAGARRQPLPRRHARPAEGVRASSCAKKDRTVATPRTRSRVSCSRAVTPSGATTRPARSSSSRTGGYYHSLPGDTLRQFIDTAAEVQRAMGFGNEKDHPEVAPSQFEMNYSYTEVTIAADQIQLYKLLAARSRRASIDRVASCRSRSPASTATACTPTCRSRARARTSSATRRGRTACSTLGWDFVERILANANDICLVLNASVNAYRRLDPHFEAPNQIKASADDRGSMVRIPIAQRAVARGSRSVRSRRTRTRTWRSTRSCGPGSKGRLAAEENDGKRSRTRFLPDNIYDAAPPLQVGKFVGEELLGEEVHAKYADLKLASADRCPKALGTQVKRAEIMYHHEVTNQYLWSQF